MSGDTTALEIQQALAALLPGRVVSFLYDGWWTDQGHTFKLDVDGHKFTCTFGDEAFLSLTSGEKHFQAERFAKVVLAYFEKLGTWRKMI